MLPTSSNWQKSSFSGTGDDNNCVELAVCPTSTRVRLREGEDPAAVLTLGPASVRGLLHVLKQDARRG